MVIEPHHDAVEEQAVDALGLLQRVPQAPPRLEIERKRHGTELRIKIKYGGFLLKLACQYPCQVDRHGCSADSSPRPDEADDFSIRFGFRLRRGSRSFYFRDLAI